MRMAPPNAPCAFLDIEPKRHTRLTPSRKLFLAKKISPWIRNLPLASSCQMASLPCGRERPHFANKTDKRCQSPRSARYEFFVFKLLFRLLQKRNRKSSVKAIQKNIEKYVNAKNGVPPKRHPKAYPSLIEISKDVFRFFTARPRCHIRQKSRLKHQ